MKSLYCMKINGEFVTNVEANQETSMNEFQAFALTFKPEFDASRDILEVECIDVAPTSTLPFKTNAWMQVGQFAVQTQIDNLILTYGLELVKDVLTKRSA